MKKTDLVILAIAVILVITLGSSYLSAKFLLKLPIGLITLLFVLYWKFMPYKNQLATNYRKYYDMMDKFTQPVFRMFSRYSRIKLGPSMEMESAPFIISSILIVILIIL